MTEEQLLEQFQANKNNVQFVSDFENTNNITIEEMINYLSNNGVD
jgi:hypothetical protein